MCGLCSYKRMDEDLLEGHKTATERDQTEAECEKAGHKPLMILLSSEAHPLHFTATLHHMFGMSCPLC